MNDEVYRNTAADVSPVNNFSTTAANPLQLPAEDRITIHHTFLRHLAQCNLTPRRVRIVLAVFNQTLGFNKLEDDMNGSRLHQLTGIAPNHANETVRDLKLLNVLVTRKGHYGSYLAINFDLAQWGQQDQALTPTVDPCFLLPEEHVNDTGLDLSVGIDKETDAVADSLDTPIKVHWENSVKSAAEQQVFNENAFQILLDAINTVTEKVTERVTQLEQKIEKLQDNQQPPLAEKPPATEPVSAPIATPEPKATPPADERVQAPSALRYPSSFNAQQCQQAASIIQRANDADKAQLLLDMLAKRLNHQHDPLRNPMRYLETLVTKLNTNQLTIASPKEYSPPKPASFVSTTTSINGEPTPEPTEAELIKAEYQEATLDCRQMQRNVNILAEREDIIDSQILNFQI